MDDKKMSPAEKRYRERFRMIEMNQEIRLLSGAMFGRNQDIRPMILTEKGKVSKPKIKKLTAQLMSLAEESRINLRVGGFTEEEKALLEAMILMAILLPGVSYGFPSEESNKKPAFSDPVSYDAVLDLLRDPSELAMDANLAAEHLNLPVPKLQTEILPGEDNLTIAEQDKDMDEYYEDEELYDRWAEEYVRAGLEAIPEEHLDSIAQQLGDEMLALEEGYEKIFPMKQEFAEALSCFCEMADRIPANTGTVFEMAVNLYLMRHDMSPLSDRDTFWRVHAECETARRRVNRKAWERRGQRA